VAILQPIEVGAASVGEIEILSGLREGDRIIISDTARFNRAQRLFLRQ
jgi:HlyD family secretion protein